MIESIVRKLVDHQIEIGTLSEDEREIYLYGYQMLMEFCINIVTSVIIAVIFSAYMIVIVYTLAYLLLRGYIGGYHAKTSLGCFGLSACMLIIAVVVVKGMIRKDASGWILLVEIVMCPIIFRKVPIPSENKPISEKERVHFNKRVKQIYVFEAILELILWQSEQCDAALSVFMVHMILFFMVIADNGMKMIRKIK